MPPNMPSQRLPVPTPAHHMHTKCARARLVRHETACYSYSASASGRQRNLPCNSHALPNIVMRGDSRPERRQHGENTIETNGHENCTRRTIVPRPQRVASHRERCPHECHCTFRAQLWCLWISGAGSTTGNFAGRQVRRTRRARAHTHCNAARARCARARYGPSARTLIVRTMARAAAKQLATLLRGHGRRMAGTLFCRLGQPVLPKEAL